LAMPPSAGVFYRWSGREASGDPQGSGRAYTESGRLVRMSTPSVFSSTMSSRYSTVLINDNYFFPALTHGFCYRTRPVASLSWIFLAHRACCRFQRLSRAQGADLATDSA